MEKTTKFFLEKATEVIRRTERKKSRKERRKMKRNYDGTDTRICLSDVFLQFSTARIYKKRERAKEKKDGTIVSLMQFERLIADIQKGS